MSSHPTSWVPDEDPDARARGYNPPRTRRLWRDRLLPRTTWPMFWALWALATPARLLPPKRSSVTRVGIESGKVGWTHVFYEELLQSAAEHYRNVPLEPIVIDRDLPYLPQFRAAVASSELTHLVLDPRTGTQAWSSVLRDTLAMTWSMTRRGIVPIVVLTDASLRRHRFQAAALTAFRGVVVTFMDRRLVSPMFPHSRIIGPLPMPVSIRRLDWLESEKESLDPRTGAEVHFIGSVYEPREQFLRDLEEELAKRDISLVVHADKYGTSNDDYWRVLVGSSIIVTTTMQGMPRPPMDWIWIQQLVFRFSEALSAGAVLAAPEVPGGDRYFLADRDYVSFASVDDAADVLARLVTDAEFRESVRRAGHETAEALNRKHAFWLAIDACLGDAAPPSDGSAG